MVLGLGRGRGKEGWVEGVVRLRHKHDLAQILNKVLKIMATEVTSKTGETVTIPSITNTDRKVIKSQDGDVITVVVDSKRFPVNKTLFTRYPNTMLGRSVFTLYIIFIILYIIH